MEPLLTIAMAVASKAVTTALEPLIHELINAQEAQNAELEQLRQEVRRLIDGPWRLSILHLRASESAGSADPARRSAELEKAAANLDRQLSNDAFLSKAPEKVVAGMRQKKAEYESQLSKKRAELAGG